MLDVTQALVVAAATAGIGYWLGRRKDLDKVVHDKRAELISRFIAKAYEGQGLLRFYPLHEGLGEHRAALAIVARELAFYTSRKAGAQVDKVADLFAIAVSARIDQENPMMHGQPMSQRINAYLPAVDAAHQTLRRELGIDTTWERIVEWRALRKARKAGSKSLPSKSGD